METHPTTRHRPSTVLSSSLAVLFCFYSLLSFAKPELGFSFKSNKRISTIPFELVDNLIIIKLKLNEGYVVKAVFDTGVRSIILYGKKYRKELDFYKSRVVQVNGLGKGKKQVGVTAHNNYISLGDVEGKGVTLVHLAHDIPFQKLKEAHVDAVFGYQLFSKFIVEINYQNMVVTFKDPDHYTCDISAYRFPIEILDTKPYVTTTVSVHGAAPIQTKWLIDTGAAVDIIVYKTSHNFKHFVSSGVKKKTIGRGFKGIIKGETSSQKIQFGKILMGNKDVHVIDKRSDSNLSQQYGADGLIGGKLLRDFVITFDYVHGHVYFKPASKLNWPFQSTK